MKNSDLTNECEKIFNFWKMEEYFSPSENPKLTLKVREGTKEIPFDACYYKGSAIQSLPLETYRSHNEYLRQRYKSENLLYDHANVYFGCYSVRTFVQKMAKQCHLNMEKYAEINELSGKFFIFSLQIDLDGRVTEDGFQVSPFFYAGVRMIKARSISVPVNQEDIDQLNRNINEILKQTELRLLKLEDILQIKNLLFRQLNAVSEENTGLDSPSSQLCVCKAFRRDEESADLNSFYLKDINLVQKNYKMNEQVFHYTTSLLRRNPEKIRIDSDVDAMKKWLEADRFPLAKYPSKFSPTFMQQIAINIAISDKDRREKVFSVNGPPGTGKTTLLKEIIASNVEQLANVLIHHDPRISRFTPRTIDSASTPNGYTERYYTIPDEISRFGILVVSNNNKAVENITLDLPRAEGLKKENTRTDHFDRTEHKEIYFSAVADQLLGKENSAWGLLSARMGRKSYVSRVLEACIFRKRNDAPNKVTLDLAREDSISWAEAKENFQKARNRVLALREDIKRDQELLDDFYNGREDLANRQSALSQLLAKQEELQLQLDRLNRDLVQNEREKTAQEEEIRSIKSHTSFSKRLLFRLKLDETSRQISEKQRNINTLIQKHGEIKERYLSAKKDLDGIYTEIIRQQRAISDLQDKIRNFEQPGFTGIRTLRAKYKNNLADRDFYNNIKKSRDSQNACPWTFEEYDRAREELFFAALQVRKAFILEFPYIKRNLFVYQAYNNGKYTLKEKEEMFPHLFNALSFVIPVLSSTFASVGRFLRHAGNQSLGMLLIDESGQAIPQSALGALYRTRSAVVVGDPLQVEPVVTIPQVLIDMLADSTGVPKTYKRMENSVQTFADSINEFNGMIGERQVGCPLVVHRRCIDPMFSISNMISYDNRMFNMTSKREEYLKADQPFVIKKSGWIHVEGPEKSAGNHFVENQAKQVCQLLESAVSVYGNLFDTQDKIFIITPFRTVAEEMRRYVTAYFLKKNYEKKLLEKWVSECIGTVHTFQGKDADEVLFVLGCSAKSTGAMNWVVKKANILNTACTRAKYRIAFIGNINGWKNRQYFNSFIPELIHTTEG